MSRVQPAPKRTHRPEPPRPLKAPRLTLQLARAHNVLANPTATDQQRRAARCRLNRTITAMRRLPPIPAMKRALQVDKQSAAIQEITAAKVTRRVLVRRSAADIALAAVATIAGTRP